MKTENIISASDDIILNLKVLAREKEKVRKKRVVTARKLAMIAKERVTTAREKETVRRNLAMTAQKLAVTARKLATTAKEKEIVRQNLAATAKKLAVTAKKLAVTAREKERVRRKLAHTASKLAVTASKLVVTAEKLAVTAEQLAATAREKEVVRRKLAVTAKEKEIVRRKLAVTAAKLKTSYETLEKKVLERTESLEMARAKEEAILLSVGDGLLATDEKGDIIFINKTAERLLGKKSNRVVGKNFSHIIPLEDEKGISIPLEKHPVNMVLMTGATNATLHTAYYKRQDKERSPLAIVVTPVILGKKVIGTIKIFRDVTSEREIDKAKTEFVSLASHQLRTPLSTVNWYAEMLLAGDVGALNKKQQKYLDEVYRSNQRMVELVNALLDVASLELGTFVIEPERVDVYALIENIIGEQKAQIEARKLRFSFSHEKSTSFMQADPKHLRMVIQNILSNAVKYTPEKGEIKFSISLENKNILMKISDTGYGIPKNQQDKIFTKLFRADNVRDKDTDGTGLGLYIVKSIVDNSGGKIWFESSCVKENGGTTFYVELPLNRILKNKKSR